MQIENAQLLNAQTPLQTLSQASLRGVHALHLKDLMEAISTRLQRLQEVQQGLMEDVQQDEKTQEEADEEWQEVLADTLDIDEEPLPQEAIAEIEISAGELMALDWLIDRGEDTEGA